MSGPGGETLLDLSFELLWIWFYHRSGREQRVYARLCDETPLSALSLRFPKHITRHQVGMQNLEVTRRRQPMSEVGLCVCLCACACVSVSACLCERTPDDMWAHRHRFSIAAALLLL